MGTMKATTLRLTSVQRAQLAKLAKKLGIKEANVIRMAIARLADAEGITDTGKR